MWMSLVRWRCDGRAGVFDLVHPCVKFIAAFAGEACCETTNNQCLLCATTFAPFWTLQAHPTPATWVGTVGRRSTYAFRLSRRIAIIASNLRSLALLLSDWEGRRQRAVGAPLRCEPARPRESPAGALSPPSRHPRQLPLGARRDVPWVARHRRPRCLGG